MSKIKTLTIDGNELDVGVPSDLSVSTATVGTTSSSGSLVVDGTGATLRVGTAQAVSSVRINGTSSPNIAIGKRGTSSDPTVLIRQTPDNSGEIAVNGDFPLVTLGNGRAYIERNNAGGLVTLFDDDKDKSARLGIDMAGGSTAEPMLLLGSTYLNEAELRAMKGGGGCAETITLENSGCSDLQIVLEAGSSSPYIAIYGGSSDDNTYLGAYGCSEPCLNLGGEELSKS